MEEDSDKCLDSSDETSIESENNESFDAGETNSRWTDVASHKPQRRGLFEHSAVWSSCHNLWTDDEVASLLGSDF